LDWRKGHRIVPFAVRKRARRTVARLIFADGADERFDFDQWGSFATLAAIQRKQLGR
jgi:hypothetical protein